MSEGNTAVDRYCAGCGGSIMAGVSTLIVGLGLFHERCKPPAFMCREVAHERSELIEARAQLSTLRAALAASQALNAEARKVVEGAHGAINASYAQGQAELRGHDRTADKQDDIVRAWRENARAFLAKTSDAGA